MCACTEPVRTGIGAVCVECGRPKWPITILNHTHTLYRRMFCFLFLAPYARTTRYEEAFFLLGKPRKQRLASLARLMIMLHDTRYQVQRAVHTADAFVRHTEKLPRKCRYFYRCSKFWNTEKWRNETLDFDFLDYRKPPEIYRA